MFNKEVKENLSKYKYVYRIYRVDNDFHIEYCPIVYSNSEYIYYKSSRKNMLNCITVNGLSWYSDKIFETVEKTIEYMNNVNSTWYPISIYFLSTKIKDYDLSQIKTNLKEESNKKKIKQMENKLKRVKEEYERALKELEEVKN